MGPEQYRGRLGDEEMAIEEIAKDVSAARKPYVCGMHYSNPVPVMRMLEIIYTPDTSQEVIEAAKVVGEDQQKIISMVKDMPGTYGFILNRVFAAAAKEAMQLVKDGSRDTATRKLSAYPTCAS